MFKIMFFVCSFLLLLLGVKCFFAGDSCYVDEYPGTCIALEECRHLVNEIHRAGSPMPSYIRHKLQKLGCGFTVDQPMVCCVPPNNIDAVNSWSSTGGLSGLPNRGNPTQTDDNVVIWDYTNSNNNNPSRDRDDTFGSGDNVATNRRGGKPNVENHPNLSLLSTDCGTIESNRIIGGNRTSLFEMPWMVLLSYQSARGLKLNCGGTLINEWYVLTAAHCVTSLPNSLKLQSVILGEYDVRQDPDCERSDGKKYCAPGIRTVAIDEAIPHTDYNPETFYNDIALLRLSEPADFNLDNMKPLCLPLTPELQDENLVGVNGVVAGWGITEDGVESSVLLSVSLPVLSKEECQSIYKTAVQINEKQLCAGGVKDKDSCAGDSGGPLMYPGKLGRVKYIQRGVVSFGTKRCGVGGFPGVYTNVAYYMDWILDNMHS